MNVLQRYVMGIDSMEKSASRKRNLLKLVKGMRSGLIDQPGPKYMNYLNKRMESLLKGRVGAINISNARREAGGFLPHAPRKYIHKRPRSERAIALQEAMMENPNMGGLKSSLSKWDKNYPTNIRGRPSHVVQRELRDNLKSKHFPLERRPGTPRTDQGRTNIKTTKSDILRDRIKRDHYSPKPPKIRVEKSVSSPVRKASKLRESLQATKRLPTNIRSLVRSPSNRKETLRDIRKGLRVPAASVWGGVGVGGGVAEQIKRGKRGKKISQPKATPAVGGPGLKELRPHDPVPYFRRAYPSLANQQEA